MYGVIIKKGPQNWQILQQKNGYSKAEISGELAVEEELLKYDDAAVMIRVVDENTGARITTPVVAKPDCNNWKAEIIMPAGGPYRIETYFRYNKIYEKRGDRIFHIGVGDVYVITGQSNAVGVGKDMVNDPISTDVHMFRLNGIWDIASHPIHDSTDTEFPLSQEKCQTGHSPWLNFAKILSRHLGYPIGLIPATKGGLPLSYWDRTVDGSFFDNMLEIIKKSGSGVKGIIWYQGCNDANEKYSSDYYERFKHVYEDFRKSFFEEIPILTVQLNKTTCLKDKDTAAVAVCWSKIREAQRLAMHNLDNVYMVPSIDCMVCDGIHNACSSNMTLGERVANLALKNIYEKDVICDAPDIERAVIEDNNKIRLFYNNVYDCIFSDFNCAQDLMFSVTDDIGRVEPSDYCCDGGNSILLIFDRPIGKNAYVSCDKYNVGGLMPYDIYSYLPCIPFDHIAVEK